MQERTRAAMRAALFEAAFVVFGVVLALAVNEWRKARLDRSEAAAALESIHQELASNREAAANAGAYHADLLAAIERSRTEGVALEARQFSRGYISPAQLYRTAWESASETGALSHLPYETVLRLARAYAQQTRYEEQGRSIGTLIYGEVYRGGSQGLLENPRGLASLISTFAYRERELVELYEETLAGSEVERE